MEQNYILCMKWGHKYGADYVNRLYNMVNRHLSLPFSMICFTDDNIGINPAIQCLPLPQLNLPKGLPERGWNKLSLFQESLYNLQGQALFLDLDIVIIDSIDCFFQVPQQHQDQLWIIRDWKKPWRLIGNSSVFRFTIGSIPSLLTYFRENFTHIRKNFRHEQAFLSWYIRRYHHIAYWPDDWCLSYKYHILKKLPLSLFQVPQHPKTGQIIIFHGEINPPNAITGGGGKWYRKVLPAQWIQDYWH